MAGEHTDDLQSAALSPKTFYRAAGRIGQKPRNRRRRGRLDKDAFLLRQEAVSLENLLILNRVDETTRFITRTDSSLPASGIADSNG